MSNKGLRVVRRLAQRLRRKHGKLHSLAMRFNSGIRDDEQDLRLAKALHTAREALLMAVLEEEKR